MPKSNIPQAGRRIGLLTGKQVPVCVHRQRDGRMPHDLLHDIGVCASHCQPRAVSQGEAGSVYSTLHEILVEAADRYPGALVVT